MKSIPQDMRHWQPVIEHIIASWTGYSSLHRKMGSRQTFRLREEGATITGDESKPASDCLSYLIKGLPGIQEKGCPNSIDLKWSRRGFVFWRCFDFPNHLQLELADDVHWLNSLRLHGTLGYLSPAEL